MDFSLSAEVAALLGTALGGAAVAIPAIFEHRRENARIAAEDRRAAERAHGDEQTARRLAFEQCLASAGDFVAMRDAISSTQWAAAAAVTATWSRALLYAGDDQSGPIVSVLYSLERLGRDRQPHELIDEIRVAMRELAEREQTYGQ